MDEDYVRAVFPNGEIDLDYEPDEEEIIEARLRAIKKKEKREKKPKKETKPETTNRRTAKQKRNLSIERRINSIKSYFYFIFFFFVFHLYLNIYVCANSRTHF